MRNLPPGPTPSPWHIERTHTRLESRTLKAKVFFGRAAYMGNIANTSREMLSSPARKSVHEHTSTGLLVPALVAKLVPGPDKTEHKVLYSQAYQPRPCASTEKRRA